jgi:hypothetical protein
MPGGGWAPPLPTAAAGRYMTGACSAWVRLTAIGR